MNGERPAGPHSPEAGETGFVSGEALQEQAAKLLESMRQASTDASLDEETRLLMKQALELLRVTATQKDWALLRYRSLFDAVPDPVSILAEDGTVLDLNKAGMAAYKRPRTEIVGKNINVLNPELPHDHMDPVWESLNRGDSYVIEVTNMRGDGTRFPVEVHSANFVFDGRKSLVAVARDLSKRHEAELRYRELMEVIDKGILVQNQAREIVYANRAALRIFGVGEGKRTNDLNLEHWRIVDQNGRELGSDELPAHRSLATGQVIESMLLGLYHREHKQLLWLTVTSVPQFAPGGSKPAQVTSLFSDVTELKRDSALFDRAQSLAHIGGWEWDANRDRVYLTDEAIRILGPAQTPENIEAMLASLREPDRRRFRAAMESVVETGGGFDLELQGSRLDGHPFWIRVIGEAEASDPTSSRVTGTLQDISLDKRTEETLRIQART
ncbi:MAG: PAS domain S-box protein, partial [Pseudoxanthomonas sp.]